jgi:ATP-dependent protease HslVU (ClpYQ) peptidase subunit
MSATVMATVVKMLESLPDSVQERVADHLREYIEDLREEWQWDTTFKKTQSQLITAARRAKQEIAAGQAKPLDYDQL